MYNAFAISYDRFMIDHKSVLQVDNKSDSFGINHKSGCHWQTINLTVLLVGHKCVLEVYHKPVLCVDRKFVGVYHKSVVG